MDINLATPALLFPAVSLLMLAYTNRFLATAALIRTLYATYKTEPNPLLVGQLKNLRYRVQLIKHMQSLAVLCTFLSVLAMFLIFEGWIRAGRIVFGISLISLLASLGLSLREIALSVNALNLQLADMEEHFK